MFGLTRLEIEAAGGVLLVVLALIGFAVYSKHEQEVGAEAVRSAVSVVGAEAAASAAVTTAEWNSKTKESVHDAQLAASAAAVSASTAVRERDAARMQLAAYLRRRAVSQGAQPATGGAPAPDPDVLLAGLLDESWQRNLDLAGEADRRGIAGAACERAWPVTP